MSVKKREYKQQRIDGAKTIKEALYWSSVGINDLILTDYYGQAGTDNFKTFSGWHEAGFKVKRGEKGWIIWAQKRTATRKCETQQNDEVLEIEFEFWSVCYLFSNIQVEPLNQCDHIHES